MGDVSYWYEGRSPQTGEWLRLPRTRQVEAIARELMEDLARDDRYNREGKMYGVLLAEGATGERHVLKAFSGLLNGEGVVEGWVPPIPGRGRVAFVEAFTLSQLDAIKQEILTLQQLPERSQLASLTQQFTFELQELATVHQQRKQLRQQHRQILQQKLVGVSLQEALGQLDQQSQQDGIKRRRLKQQRNEQLQPLKEIVDKADSQLQQLRQQRKQLSKQLQAQMHEAYRLTNFAGTTTSLNQLMPNGTMPTGTGDCCAPKLLHYAATHNLKPLAMAEFWWGTPSAQEEKIPGEFYGACRDRCQPLMGFLLSGLAEGARAQGSKGIGSRERTSTVSLSRTGVGKDLETQNSKLKTQNFSALSTQHLYEDDWLIAVEKPAGLLSVPGRYHNRQDSVLSRMQLSELEIRVVHRLDQDTSGILLLARDLQTYRQLSQQFEQRQAHKLYEALLDGTIAADEGSIELPLWADLEHRPRQIVDWQCGKPSITKFRVLARENNLTRIEFLPLTGRTHQLRVHAATGLGTPILGDHLYGCLKSNSLWDGHLARPNSTRLHLHAKELVIQHPRTGRSLQIQSPVPF